MKNIVDLLQSALSLDGIKAVFLEFIQSIPNPFHSAYYAENCCMCCCCNGGCC